MTRSSLIYALTLEVHARSDGRSAQVLNDAYEEFLSTLQRHGMAYEGSMHLTNPSALGEDEPVTVLRGEHYPGGAA